MNLAGRGIAVFCGSSPGGHGTFADAAHAVGRQIVAAGAHVVYGGGATGLMGAVADGALRAGGRVIGVMPHFLAGAEIAHQNLTESIRVETMHVRKALMADRSSAFVIIPGGFGTYDEFIEIVTWKQLKLHAKPIVLLNLDGFFNGLLRQVDHAIECGFIRAEHRGLFDVVPNVGQIFDALARHAEPPTESHEELG